MAKGSRKTDREKEDLAAEVEEESSEEEVAREDNGKTSTEEVDELSNEEKLALEVKKAREDYLRLAAEFDNYKKRTNRDFSNLVKTANERLISELLEFVDNFERALESGDEKPELEAYHKGMKLVLDQLMDILRSHGLEPFDSVGEKFDPNLHEAVMQVESEDYDTDEVSQEFLKGYKLNDKVIRHAKVAVVGEKDQS